VSFVPPAPTTAGKVDVIDPVDVEVTLDPGPADIWVPAKEPVFANPELVDERAVLEVSGAPPAPEPLGDDPEAGWAQATP
jgi:hypothetical protein